MKTSTLLEPIIKKKSPFIPMPMVYGMLRRIAQLEDDFERDVGYIPGKPVGKEGRVWKDILGI